MQLSFFVSFKKRERPRFGTFSRAAILHVNAIR